MQRGRRLIIPADNWHAPSTDWKNAQLSKRAVDRDDICRRRLHTGARPPDIADTLLTYCANLHAEKIDVSKIDCVTELTGYFTNELM